MPSAVINVIGSELRFYRDELSNINVRFMTGLLEAEFLWASVVSIAVKEVIAPIKALIRKEMSVIPKY